MNKWGALAGIISGGISVILWEYVVTPLGVKHSIDALTIYELLPAFIIACIAIVAVSLITKAPEKEIVDEFETVKAEK
jgi:sodium/proline symporter